MLEQYRGLQALAIGLSVRIRWSSKYPHSKATIIGVGDDTEMDELFEEKKRENQQNIEQVRKSRDHRTLLYLVFILDASVIYLTLTSNM